MMLEMVNVEMIYNRVIMVLKGISLQVPEGGIIALLGANGAGKTSTLKSISGLEHTEEGEVTRGYINFEGQSIHHMDPTEIARLGIVQVMEGRKVLEHLSVEQNLLVGSHLRKDMVAVKNDLELVYDYFPKLRDLRTNTSGYLSGGEQQMLVVGRALMARPKLMLLDEPSWACRHSWSRKSTRSWPKSTSAKKSPCSWWNRTCASPCPSLSTATSWKTAASSWTARPPR